MSFGLVARFALREDRTAEFDRLTREIVTQVHQAEPDTLVYACHEVEGEPLARVFYEVYRDRAAFDRHEEHGHTQRFVEAREPCMAAQPRVEFLQLSVAKGVPTA